MFDTQLLTDAAELLELCRRAGLKIATAESCTGGLIAGCLTEIAGSSDVVERGFVTYSNEAKQEMLGVPRMLINLNGAVSEKVAVAMAEGALKHSLADISVAVTGVAGPGGGSKEKPVGLVHLACAGRGRRTVTNHQIFPGDRADIRDATVQTAFSMLRRAATEG
ncbi:MAG: CinA family protein [Alphaproteobacteria bacterium]|jgi:nicotinamide-nucleotide amidase|nr:CinA family protein [Alphaproteobacteria bacterium]